MSVAITRALRHRCSLAILSVTLAAGLTLGTPRQAQALTIILDFATGSTTDIFGAGTTAANFTPYGFGLSLAQIESASFAAVANDYLGYSTVGANPLSPLPNGKQLNINFELSTGLSAPVNGDTEYYYVAIGNHTGANPGFLGQACLSCVRAPVETGPNFGVTNHSIVGSILVDNIATLAGLASTDTERINLLAGTITHEIGHTLSLDHPGGPVANPGASIYDVMATGAAPTSMPNGERIKDRAFSYVDFGQLISAVGLRDAPVAAVPEPETYALLLAGLGLLGFAARRRKKIEAAA